jgi:hypothetical protein
MSSSISRLAAACVLAAACAGTDPGGATRSVVSPRGVLYGASAVGVDELSRVHPELDVYQALERVRPNFLRIRPGSHVLRTASPRIRVYINGNYAGDVSTLRSIRVRDVASVRRLQATETHLLAGAEGEHEGGAILVTLLP